MVDIVIPYLEQGNDWKLRATLRGIDTYLRGDYRIVIIGDYPVWLRNVTYFPHRRDTNQKMVRCYDANSKMLKVIELDAIRDDILVWHDDMLLIREMEVSELCGDHYCLQRYTKEHINHLKEYGSRWQSELLVPTIEHLIKNNMPRYSFETHVPRHYYKPMLANVFSKHDILNNNYLYATIYYNEYTVGGIPLRGSKYKASFVGYEGPYSLPMDGRTVNTAFKEYTFINWNDAGLTPYLRHRIINNVTTRSLYEKFDHTKEGSTIEKEGI